MTNADGQADPTGILLIADGLGDRPVPALGNKTPLEYANTPTLDKLAAEGCAGLVHPYKPGYRVGTDWGHLCIFGYDPAPFYSGRGSLEAASAGIDLRPGDVAFRGNFATFSPEWAVVDRRAGRIRESEDIAQLAAAVDGAEIDGCVFLVKPLTEHRLALVMRGEGLCGSVPDTDPGTAKEGMPAVNPSLNCPEDAKHTADLLWKFLHHAYGAWKDHPVNRRREQEGKLPANGILTRGSGSAMVLPPMSGLFPGLKGAVIAGDVTITGIGKLCGLAGFTRPGFTGSGGTDYKGKAKLALELLEKYNFVIVHVKATDLCGHDNLPEEKAKVIEHIDGMFKTWLDRINPARTYLAMTADHSTPCHFREHSGDPVPSFLWGPHVRQDRAGSFGERACGEGLLNNYTASGFTRTLMDYLDHNKKLGA
ncbi:MAG: 2,3-bisphosphoglycerate-independent phosphoglycerate mutase [Treponemataceae bacterium]|nr:MAG: 2,3-bisphosphoglycerate-independent phosphoglycerate mutase [Treponemataceae bacterium]